MTFDKESLKPLYQLVIGEAGESCALYIAKKLGMPEAMLKEAELASYGTVSGTPASALDSGTKTSSAGGAFCNAQRGTWEGGAGRDGNLMEKVKNAPIKKQNASRSGVFLADKFKRGDSVMVFPDRKIGIVCETINEKGVLRVQMPDKKIYINHKRVRLHVAAQELYPEDYDFSIIFDTVENRKKRHQMERKYVEDVIVSGE